MKGNIQLLALCAIICSLTRRAEAGDPAITSCTLSGKEGINSNLTVELTYNGQPHSYTQLGIHNPEGSMANLSCEGLWNSTGFPSHTKCYSGYNYIYFYYSSTSISTATFIISGLSFRSNPQTYPKFLYVYIRNDDNQGSQFNCSSFTSPSYTAQLIGVSLNMMDNTTALAKTRIHINFQVQNAIPAAITYYVFRFPPDSLSTSSIATANIISGSSQIDDNILTFTSTSALSTSTTIMFTINKIRNPHVSDAVVLGISLEADGNTTWQAGKALWNPVIRTIPIVQVSLDSTEINTLTTYNFQFDFVPKFQRWMRMKINCGAGLTLSPTSSECGLGYWNSSLTSTEITCSESTSTSYDKTTTRSFSVSNVRNPTSTGTYYLNVTTYKTYNTIIGTQLVNETFCKTTNIEVYITNGVGFGPSSEVVNAETRPFIKYKISKLGK